MTDIIVEPTTFSTTDHYEVLIGVDGYFGRSFSTRHIGSDTKHYTFTGGFVVPEGTTLKAINLSTSADDVFNTVYGYLTKVPASRSMSRCFDCREINSESPWGRSTEGHFRPQIIATGFMGHI